MNVGISAVGLLSLLTFGCAQSSTRADALGDRAVDCANCHQAEFDEWNGSPHQTSGSSAAFEALVEEATAERGDRAGQECTSCHQPGFTADQNISCLTCHGASGNFGTKNGRLSTDLSLAIGGTESGTNYAHEVRGSGFLSSPELCGTCHQVEQPGLFEPTFDEFEQYQALGGTRTCVDCHMRDDNGDVNHSFSGPDHNSGFLKERLRDGLHLTLTRDPEDRALVQVTLENAGVGHSVPTGVSMLRQMWVEVTLGDEPSRRVLTLDDEPLAPGEVRVVTLSATQTVTARLYRRTLRDDVSARLGLAPVEAEVLLEKTLPF